MNEYENIETVETVENNDQGSSVDVPGTDDPILSDSVSIESDMVQDAGSVTEEPPTAVSYTHLTLPTIYSV